MNIFWTWTTDKGMGGRVRVYLTFEFLNLKKKLWLPIIFLFSFSLVMIKKNPRTKSDIDIFSVAFDDYMKSSSALCGCGTSSVYNNLMNDVRWTHALTHIMPLHLSFDAYVKCLQIY